MRFPGLVQEGPKQKHFPRKICIKEGKSRFEDDEVLSQYMKIVFSPIFVFVIFFLSYMFCGTYYYWCVLVSSTLASAL